VRDFSLIHGRVRGVISKPAVATFEANGRRYNLTNGDTGGGDVEVAGAGKCMMLSKKVVDDF
jgi:hypothetical protein